MTDFTDRVVLRLNGSLPIIQLPTDAVKNIWWFEDGKWAPIGFANHGNSYLTLTDYNNNPPDTPLNLFAYTIADTGGEPILTIDRGMTVQKDLTAGGFVCSNQGELWLGSGRDNQLDVPKIILQNSGASILNGGGFCDIPPIPTGHAGSGSFPSDQPAGTYYLRTDAGEPYHNRVFKFDGSNWIDTAPTNNKASQLYRSIDAIFDQAADTIFKSGWDNDTHWSWIGIGPASDYTGRYFDTLYLTKLDGATAHLDVGNLTVHGNITAEGSILNLPSITLGEGTIYWQTATDPDVLEMDCGLIIDGALNVAGVSVNGDMGVTGGLVVGDDINNLKILTQGGIWTNISNTLTDGLLINYNTGVTWGDVFQIFNGGTTMLMHVDASGNLTATNSIITPLATIGASVPTITFKTTQVVSNALGWLDFYTYGGTRQWLVGMSITGNNGDFEFYSYNSSKVAIYANLYTNGSITMNAGNYLWLSTDAYLVRNASKSHRLQRRKR